MRKKMETYNQKYKGTLLIPAVGILLFLLVISFASFKDNIFSRLYPKPASIANESTTIPVPVHKEYRPAGLLVDQNLNVLDVTSGYPASNSGIKKGDKIQKIDIADLTATSTGLTSMATEAYSNTSSKNNRDFVILRDGQTITVSVSNIFKVKDIKPNSSPIPSGLYWF